MGKGRGKIDDNAPKSEAFSKNLRQKVKETFEKVGDRLTGKTAPLKRYVTKEKTPTQKIKTVSLKKRGVVVEQRKKIVNKGPGLLKDRLYIKTYSSDEGKPVMSKTSLNPLNPFKKERYLNRKSYKS